MEESDAVFASGDSHHDSVLWSQHFIFGDCSPHPVFDGSAEASYTKILP